MHECREPGRPENGYRPFLSKSAFLNAGYKREQESQISLLSTVSWRNLRLNDLVKGYSSCFAHVWSIILGFPVQKSTFLYNIYI